MDIYTSQDFLAHNTQKCFGGRRSPLTTALFRLPIWIFGEVLFIDIYMRQREGHGKMEMERRQGMGEIGPDQVLVKNRHPCSHLSADELFSAASLWNG